MTTETKDILTQIISEHHDPKVQIIKYMSALLKRDDAEMTLNEAIRQLPGWSGKPRGLARGLSD